MLFFGALPRSFRSYNRRETAGPIVMTTLKNPSRLPAGILLNKLQPQLSRATLTIIFLVRALTRAAFLLRLSGLAAGLSTLLLALTALAGLSALLPSLTTLLSTLTVFLHIVCHEHSSVHCAVTLRSAEFSLSMVCCCIGNQSWDGKPLRRSKSLEQNDFFWGFNRKAIQA